MFNYVLVVVLFLIPLAFNHIVMSVLKKDLKYTYMNISVWIYPLFTIIVGFMLEKIELSDEIGLMIFTLLPFIGLFIMIDFLKFMNISNLGVFGVVTGVLIYYTARESFWDMVGQSLKVYFLFIPNLSTTDYFKIFFVYGMVTIYAVIKLIIFSLRRLIRDCEKKSL